MLRKRFPGEESRLLQLEKAQDSLAEKQQRICCLLDHSVRGVSAQEMRATFRNIAAVLEHGGQQLLLNLSRSLRDRGYERPGTQWQYIPQQAMRAAHGAALSGKALGLLTFHPSGYVREEALRIVVARRSEWCLRYIVLRLDDWVAQVRVVAEQAFALELPRASLSEIVEALPCLEDIEGRTGHQGQFRAAILERISQNPEGIALLQAAMGHQDARLRGAAMRTLATSGLISRLDLVKALLNNADAGLMRLPVDLLRDFNWGEIPDDVLEGLSRTGNRFLRLESLRWMIRHAPEKYLLPRLHAALLDSVRTIQWCAEFHLAKRGRGLVSAGYRDALFSADPKELRCALRGAGYFGLKEETERIRELCSHSQSAIRCAALKSLCRIDSAGNHEYIVRALLEDGGRLCRLAMRILLRLPFEESCSVTVACLRRGGLPGSETEAWLGLIAHLPKRDRLCCLLIALRTCSSDLRAAVLKLLDWQLEIGVSTSFEPWQREEIELCLAQHRHLLSAGQASRLKDLLAEFA